MANPLKGEVTLKAGEALYTLVFSVNAICELEDDLGEPVAKIADKLNDPESLRMTTVRALVWAALRDHHEGVDHKEAGAIASEAGIANCMEAIAKAFQLAFPADREDADSPRPSKAKAG
jgi:hypothetical protein